MHISRIDRPALILVDIQKGFDNIEYWGGQRNNPYAEENASHILELWRVNGLPIFHIQHCSINPLSPLHEGNAGNAFKDEVRPLNGERVIKKSVNSAFIGTDLEERLEQDGVSKLVIVGLTTDHCVSTTTRMAGNLGYETFLVADATATFSKKGIGGEEYPAELIHATALASLKDEFATIIMSDALGRSMGQGKHNMRWSGGYEK